jgi:hypothetical protein
MTTSVVVDKIPNCDFCKEPTPAYADGQTMMGPWANMCKPCFDMYGVGLGLGKGQRLLTKSETVTIEDGYGLPHIVPITEEWREQ